MGDLCLVCSIGTLALQPLYNLPSNLSLSSISVIVNQFEYMLGANRAEPIKIRKRDVTMLLIQPKKLWHSLTLKA